MKLGLRNTKQILNLVVGRKTKRNLSIITKSVLKLNLKRVFTDRLPMYKKSILTNQHNAKKKNTTVIERYNLTLRTRLKRLSRRTICFSKNFEMLEATLKLHFWSKELKI